MQRDVVFSIDSEASAYVRMPYWCGIKSPASTSTITDNQEAASTPAKSSTFVLPNPCFP